MTRIQSSCAATSFLCLFWTMLPTRICARCVNSIFHEVIRSPWKKDAGRVFVPTKPPPRSVQSSVPLTIVLRLRSYALHTTPPTTTLFESPHGHQRTPALGGRTVSFRARSCSHYEVLRGSEESPRICTCTQHSTLNYLIFMRMCTENAATHGEPGTAEGHWCL